MEMKETKETKEAKKTREIEDVEQRKLSILERLALLCLSMKHAYARPVDML